MTRGHRNVATGGETTLYGDLTPFEDMEPEADASRLQPGTSLGPYRIVDLIGRGSMGAVYRAHQPSLQRDVAVKVLAPQLAVSPTFRGRFRQEALAIARLRHPNVINAFDAGITRGLQYIAMEYATDGTLKQRMPGRFAPLEVVHFLEPIASALDHAHEMGVIHRDIKPSNILVRNDGSLALADFGLAKLLVPEMQKQLTHTGSVLGTPEYMAPELAHGEEPTARSDIYALAVVAYEMINGKPPFSATTAIAVLMAHSMQTVPAIPGSDGETKRANRVWRRALAKKPTDRYGTASALVSALKEAYADRVSQEGHSFEKSRSHLWSGVVGSLLDRLPKPAVMAGLTLAALTTGAFLYVMVVSSETLASTQAETEAAQSTRTLAFEDDFDSAEPSLFPVGSGVTSLGIAFERSLQDGKYSLQIGQTSGPGIASPGPAWTLPNDFFIEVEAQAAGIIGNLAYGFFLDLEDGSGPRILIRPATGEYQVNVLENGQRGVVVRAPSTAINLGTSINLLRLEVRGKELALIVNGTHIETLAVPSLAARPIQIRLGVLPLGGPIFESDMATAVFDHFRVVSIVSEVSSP